MLKTNRGGEALISGHSAPQLVNKLIGEERYELFNDSNYNNLFVVMASEVGNGAEVKITF